MAKKVSEFEIGTHLIFGGFDEREKRDLRRAVDDLTGHHVEVEQDVYDRRTPDPDAEGRLHRWATVMAHQGFKGGSAAQNELRSDLVRIRLLDPDRREVFNTMPDD